MTVVVVVTAASLNAAYAGPPFTTDDPEPVEYGHFESFLFSQGASIGGAINGTAIGAEVNYGLLPDLQISASVPIEFSSAAKVKMTFDFSDAEVGIKYRFMQEGDGWRPQISFYPSLEATFTDHGERWSPGITHAFFPVWAQKSVGSWTTFGGGGYRVNLGRESRNSWFAGWAVQRRLDDRLQLGAELFGETAEIKTGEASLGANITAVYAVSSAVSLNCAVGPIADGPNDRTGMAYYLAIGWTK